MIWSEVRQAYHNQWLIIEALEAHTTPDTGILTISPSLKCVKVAVMQCKAIVVFTNNFRFVNFILSIPGVKS